MASFVDYPAPMGMINMDYISKYKAEEIDGVFGITLIGGSGSNDFSVWENTGVKATINIGNNTFTAVETGTAGNSITVNIVVSGTNTPQSIDLTSNAITFNSATDASDLAISTENDITNAFNTDENISALIDSLINTGDGTSVVSSSGGAQSLATGVNDTSEADRDAFIALVNAEFLLVT